MPAEVASTAAVVGVLSLACAVVLAGASSSSTSSSADVAPQQLHIALAGEGGMRVAWKTNNATAQTVCVYGTSPSALTFTARGSAVQYLSSGGGFHHVCKLTNLTTGTPWWYSCGDGTPANSNPPVSFTTPAPSDPVRLAVFGDWGYEDSVLRPMAVDAGGLSKNWSASLTRDLLTTLQARGAISSGVYHVGDIGYADDSFGHVGEVLNFGYEAAYDGFMQWLSPLSAYIPYHVAVGNHESECHSPYCILHPEVGLVLNNFTAYNTRWAMPSVESGGVLNMWYSYRLGPVHVVAINTETDFPGAPEGEKGDSGVFPAGHFAPEGVYMGWLAGDLAAAAADPTVKWIIAGGHRPFESFSSGPVASLFKQFGVDVYFAGHTHSYARYDPSAYGDGAVHVTVGGAGCDEMPYPPDQLLPLSQLSEHAEGVTGTEACRAWCADPAVRAGFAHEEASVPAHAEPCRVCDASPVFVSSKMAIGVLTATESSLQWQLLRAPDGAVLDTLTLNK